MEEAKKRGRRNWIDGKVTRKRRRNEWREWRGNSMDVVRITNTTRTWAFSKDDESVQWTLSVVCDILYAPLLERKKEKKEYVVVRDRNSFARGVFTERNLQFCSGSVIVATSYLENVKAQKGSKKTPGEKLEYGFDWSKIWQALTPQGRKQSSILTKHRLSWRPIK